MKRTALNFSFIIPAKNEEAEIYNTISSIREFVPDNFSYEIVVVDNGSGDNTREIARNVGAKVYIDENATIAQLRNIGVSKATGDYLIFLDADVQLTRKWSHEIGSVFQVLMDKPLLVTGSRCNSADKNNFIQKYWFQRMLKENSKYINSGHLITTRSLFNQINGFNAELKTAEDYDFCRRAQAVGARIRNNPELTVIHSGYPETFVAFLKREMWHGAEDFKNLNSFFSSKQAVVAILHILIFFGLVGYTLISGDVRGFVAYIGIMFFLVLFFSIMKFGFLPLSSLVMSSIVFYFYLLGRSLALMHKLWPR